MWNFNVNKVSRNFYDYFMSKGSGDTNFDVSILEANRNPNKPYSIPSRKNTALGIVCRMSPTKSSISHRPITVYFCVFSGKSCLIQNSCQMWLTRFWNGLEPSN